MTNLALKGIIGLGAMGQISDFLGNNLDGADFQVRAHTFAGGSLLILDARERRPTLKR